MGLRRKLLCFYPTTETGSKLNPAVFRIQTQIDLALLDPYWECGSKVGDTFDRNNLQKGKMKKIL
jgi:hypothetical protein